MCVRWTERIFAASLPAILLVLNFIALFLAILVPVIFYLIAKRLGFRFASDHALRVFDLLISVMVVSFVVGLLITGLSTATRDGGATLTIFNSGLLHNLLYLVFIVYIGLAVLLHMAFSLLGKEFKMPLALRPFETLRGKRSSNKTSKMDAQTTHTSS